MFNIIFIGKSPIFFGGGLVPRFGFMFLWYESMLFRSPRESPVRT